MELLYRILYQKKEEEMKKKQWRPFEEAKKFVRSLKLKNQDEWMEYSKSDERPSDIPTNPHAAYKNDGWKSLGDWLGTGRTRVEASRQTSWCRNLSRRPMVRISAAL